MRDIPAGVLFDSLRGKPTPKRSKIVYSEGTIDPCNWLKTNQLRSAIKQAAREKRKVLKRKPDARFKERLKEVLIPCSRRFLELMGISGDGFAYSGHPVTIKRPERYIYELFLGFEPICSFTDIQEAQHSLYAMQQHGYPHSYITQRDLRR